MSSLYERLLTPIRYRETTIPGRDRTTEMLSDTARVVTSSAFRRLQSKAQVFSLEQNASVRTRLTHTLEVAQYGQFIAHKVFDGLLATDDVMEPLRLGFVKVVENACLIHDMGNPPFGHLGEFAIREWFENHREKLLLAWCHDQNKNTKKELERRYSAFEDFDGNPQAIRIVQRLQWLDNDSGLNLSYPLIASIAKYLGLAPDQDDKMRRKIGFWETDLKRITEVWKKLGLKTDGKGVPTQRHPLAFIMEAADDIAYCLSDIEDALEKKILTERKFFTDLESESAGLVEKFPVKFHTNRVAPNGKFIKFKVAVTNFLVDHAAAAYLKNHDKIIKGTLGVPLLECDKDAFELSETLKKFAKREIFLSREAVEVELSGYEIVQQLLTTFLPALTAATSQFVRLFPGATDPPKYGELALAQRLFALLPRKHLLAYHELVKEIGLSFEPIARTHLVVDYISGMTDSHALKVFNILTGRSSAGSQ